ncbi:MAG TPA: patatin family protein [Crocinitomicaceae bacterium]|nr:patatin family protein [Crocinitomicaceae bacterium]
MPKKTLIIQGGGFRTAFSAGVLDAFIASDYNPFDSFYVVSGGSIAVSYYLSKQYKKCFESTCLLATDKDFMSYNKLLRQYVLMDLDYFHVVASEKVPFDISATMQAMKGKKMNIVMTNKITGLAEYYHPTKKTWMDAVIASCTLPFVTKGKHVLHDNEYMDGGWSDPLPIEQAVKDGASDITIIRTSPKDLKVSQSWTDKFGTYAFRANPKLQACFENNHQKYNDSIDFINSKPKGVKIQQIAPEVPLQTGTYSNSISLLEKDYRHGVALGLDFLQSLKK